MPPGAEEAIEAASQRGYEAVVLVLVMGAMLFFFGLLGKWFIKSTDKRLEEASDREKRLATRIDVLEAFVHNTLLKMVQENAAMMIKNIEAAETLIGTMSQRLCILSPDRQDATVDRIADRVGERIAKIAREQERT